MRAVNLLPPDVQRTRFDGGRFLPVLAGGGGIVLITAAAVLLATSASSAAADKQAEIEAVEQAIERLPDAPTPEVSQGVLAQERADRIAALSAALAARVSFDRLLGQVSLVMPEDAWLTRLRAAPPAPSDLPPGAEPTPSAGASSAPGVTIEGATFSHASVASVLARLSVVPSLENVTLTGTSVSQLADPSNEAAKKKRKPRSIVIFTVSADLRTGTS